MSKKRDIAGLPSREALQSFIADSADPVGKREITRHFDVQGQDKMALRRLLREMAEAG